MDHFPFYDVSLSLYENGGVNMTWNEEKKDYNDFQMRCPK